MRVEKERALGEIVKRVSGTEGKKKVKYIYIYIYIILMEGKIKYRVRYGSSIHLHWTR